MPRSAGTGTRRGSKGSAGKSDASNATPLARDVQSVREMRRVLLKIPALLTLLFSATQALASPSAPARLTPVERDTLRYHLENLFNEVDLLVKNQRADESDVQRQEREFQGLQVYERIPFQENLTELKSQLAGSASDHGLILERIAITHRSQEGGKVPSSIYTDNSGFHLKPGQVVQTLDVRAVVKAKTPAELENWVHGWKSDVLRLVEPSGTESSCYHPLGTGEYAVSAIAYRFREEKFPTLVPRNPMELLPGWARRDPDSFARNESLLWDFVKKIQALEPKTPPLYRNRERFLLNDARYEFFLKKASP